jgi:hypothetical protein
MADEEVQVFDVSDIVDRSVKTALQSFLGALPFALITDITKPALLAAGVAAASAAVSVLYNVAAQYAASRKSRVQL